MWLSVPVWPGIPFRRFLAEDETNSALCNDKRDLLRGVFFVVFHDRLTALGPASYTAAIFAATEKTKFLSALISLV